MCMHCTRCTSTCIFRHDHLHIQEHFGCADAVFSSTDQMSEKSKAAVQQLQADRAPKKGFSSPLVWLERVSPGGKVEIEMIGGNDHFCEWAAANVDLKGVAPSAVRAITKLSSFEPFSFMKKYGSRAGFADVFGWSDIQGTVACGAACS